jgi:hypothetical protein
MVIIILMIVRTAREIVRQVFAGQNVGIKKIAEKIWLVRIAVYTAKVQRIPWWSEHLPVCTPICALTPGGLIRPMSHRREFGVMLI